MLYWTTLKVALASLMANKFRTALAMLGIIIGVGAVISMVAIGAGARKKVMARVGKFGSNFLFVKPQYSTENGVTSEEEVPTLTVEDGLAIAAQVKDIDAVCGMVWEGGQISYSGKNTWCSFIGVSPTFFQVRNFDIAEGRIFTDYEDINCSPVAVIGAEVKRKLFGTAGKALGEKVRINGFVFTVIGINKRKGDTPWRGADNLVMIPLTTAMKTTFGHETLNEINVKASNSKDVDAVIARTTILLRRRHGLRPTQSNDFHIRSQAAVLEMEMEFQKTLNTLLASIAGISLFVGGIGIMNIMLVTVKERTREIGVRKAIGAREKDVLRQFLLEAIFMCSIGGIFGAGTGILSSILIEYFSPEYPTIIEPYSIVLSLMVSCGVGIFFGYYPASRAAKLNTIDALRYE